MDRDLAPRAGAAVLTRALVLVFGDQLDGESAAFDGFDPAQDAILQIEARAEASDIPQHKRRIVFFFAAMRHFRDEQRALGRTVHYSALDDAENRGAFAPEIARWVEALAPERVIALEPGDFRVRAMLENLPFPVEIRDDRHFLCPRDVFNEYASERGHLLLENFYRLMRRRLGVLVDEYGAPAGGAWNYDVENRAALGRKPPPIPVVKPFSADATTRAVLSLVAREFPNAPGSLANYDLPATRGEALAALDEFVVERMPLFGRYQDAMRGGEPYLFHSRLSGPLNLHLLSPQEVIDAVLENPADAPLAAVEGFVRQMIGWREYMRGVYWRYMPDYAQENALGADLPVPRFFWTGETDMACLADAIGHTIDHAYAHHIERLMVLGLFLLLLGARPYDVHRWHMSMFWDAIDWVSLPNTLGMSQYGDGGRIASKPYVASGAYIQRMSDHCGRCRYDPKKALGEDACPFTTLYWDFLARHKARFADNVRMRYAYLNLARRDPSEIAAIRHRADALKANMTAETFLNA